MTTTSTPSPALAAMRDRLIRTRKSQIATPGDIDAATTAQEWISRVNGQFIVSQRDVFKKRIPETLLSAISADGTVQVHAEIYLFGKWLLLDGAPGRSVRRGLKPDARKIVQTLCAAVHVAEGLGIKIGQNGLPAAAETKVVTKTNVAKAYKQIFGKKADASDFDSRLKTLLSALDDYLKLLATRTYIVDGKVVTRSPRLQKLLPKLTPAENGKRSGAKSKTKSAPAPLPTKPTVVASAAPSPAASAPGFKSAAILPKMELELTYAHPNRQEEYRTSTHAMMPVTKLPYTWQDPVPDKSSAKLRSDRENIFVLTPDLDIAANFNIRALIDRMAITLMVKQPADASKLHVLLKASDARGYVHDRALRPTGDLQSIIRFIPGLYSKIPYGQYFVILIQEPTPAKLKTFLESVHEAFEIVGTVVPEVIELSIDFTSKRKFGPQETVVLREQMVGIVHRHFWCKPERLKDQHNQFDPRNDERQVYSEQDPERTTTRFLIADRNRKLRYSSYAWRDDPTIRAKIKTKPTTGIYLNSTVYHGSRELGFRISLQHKIADERNRAAKKAKILSNKERRARVELELHRISKPEVLGLTSVNDLARMNFRKAISEFCSFKLPVIQRTDSKLQDYVDVFGLRGVCSTALLEEVKAQEEREALEAKGIAVKRDRRKIHGLQPWKELNTLTGKALDRLTESWKKFSWP